MKESQKLLFGYTIVLTTTAIAISLYLSGLESPTGMEQQLATTLNTIAVAGVTFLWTAKWTAR
ncbi:hypothetical protein [Roseofilum casamattae]|uniref:Uncharacterized protein n=1 Tax=Roseofilum casamattae BLCC-M143 TaxID=3022442 RepID=A0ABT7BS45_9CYAN|nr:hypothetical protein [Roseofilum casamattae]MDJ1181895.1 hypothetical protein [Roseofilum casamattae BLCC-M143]